MADDKAMRRERIIKRIVREFKPGSLINLGIGMPTLCADFLPQDSGIMLHSENGFIGLGPLPSAGPADMAIVNAGGAPVSIQPGGCFFDSALSFGIIRGGHVDATVLGALEVDQEGNLANYMVPGKMVPGMGGAMDLVVGARQVIIAMEHVDKEGRSKILKRCRLPLPAVKQVDLIVTDMAFIRVTPDGLLLEEIAEDTSVEAVVRATEATLKLADNIGRF